MPLDTSATQTTATNSATYLVNKRRRVFATGASGVACCSASTPAPARPFEARKPLTKLGTLIDDYGTKVGPSCPSCREASLAYSMTSSASAITVGATVRPSVAAVLRLMANSNFAGACAGSSAGLAPFKMRSTYEAERRTVSDAFGPYDIRPPSLMGWVGVE